MLDGVASVRELLAQAGKETWSDLTKPTAVQGSAQVPFVPHLCAQRRLMIAHPGN